MALLYDARLRAIDSNGNLLVGAKLTIYTANTTTPAAVFRDAALTIPMTNPTSGADASDAGGWFPQIFAAEGTAVDITLKDSSGSTVETYVDVLFVGGDETGEINRTLADDTRFKVRGSGSVVYMEFGSPSPDNIGGTAVIGGWAGTQADLITVNAALFNVTGRFQENSKELPSVVYTEATTFTSVATLEIALPNVPTGTVAWDIELWDLSGFSPTDSVVSRLSYDGGLTFKSGATDYDTLGVTLSTTYTGGANTDTNIQLATAISAPSNRLGRMRIRIVTPNGGVNGTTVDGRVDAQNTAGTPRPCIWLFSGVGRGGYGRATHIRLLGLPNPLTLSGKYRVTALRGFGEA